MYNFVILRILFVSELKHPIKMIKIDEDDPVGGNFILINLDNITHSCNL